MKKRILEHLEENDEVSILEDLMRAVDDYNGLFDGLRVYENDECTLRMFFGDELEDLARAICYGDYNYNDNFLRLDGYGNIETLNEYELEREVLEYKDDIINAFIDLVESGDLNLEDYIDLD